MVALHPYPRGFVIFRRDSSPTLPEGWSTVSLGDSEWLFAHDHLETPELVTVGDGDHWVLVHGLCLYAGEDERDMTPAQRLAEAAASDESSFLELLDELGGRHIVLLGHSHSFSLYQDASGMRSVYFSSEADLVTSHVHLLNGLQPHRERTPDQGLSGFMRAWARTPFLGIDAMLPNHSLTVPGYHITRFFPRRINRFSSWTVQDRIVEFRNLWERQWKQLLARRNELVMSVTGGNDSRTSLALLAHEMDSIKTFTYTVPDFMTTDWARSLQRDRLIVEQIKSCVNLKHRYISMGSQSPITSQAAKSTIAKNSVGTHGTWLLPYYIKHFSDESVIHIRGNTFGVYKAPWGSRNNNDNVEGLRKQYVTLTKSDQPAEPPESREQYFLSGVKRWEYNKDQFGYHRLELLYWEIRLGRWASEIYNETDIAFASFDPTNVRSLIEIALSFTISEKRNKFFQAELINSAYPILNFPGKNDTRNLYEQTRTDSYRTTTPHKNETPIDLEPTMELTTETSSDVSTLLAGGDNDLFIPAEKFLPGTTAARKIKPLPANGTLTFTLLSPYSKREARNSWYYQVTVNGVPYARWEGALRRRPTHVTLANLKPTHNVEIQAVALRNRQDIDSWEGATRATITDLLFTEEQVTGDPGIATDYPGSVLESCPELITVHLDNIEQLDSNSFTEEIPQRLNVVTKHCVIPLLVIKRRQARRTVIMCNGAVDLARSKQQPVFQRSTWWPDIPHHQIYICDPATTGEDAVSIAWGQYSAAYWIVPDTSWIVRTIADSLFNSQGIDRIYFGSSSGGFLALALLAYDTQAKAVVNNAQFDWTTWYPSHVEALRVQRLESKPLSHLNRSRTNVLQLLATKGVQPRIDYWVNTALPHDRQKAWPQFEQFLQENPTLTSTISFQRYNDDNAGHAPLSKEHTLSLLIES